MEAVMSVPALSIIFMIVSAILSMGVPFCLFVFLRKKFALKFRPMIFGIAGFVIFALILESSIHRVVLGRFPIRQEAPALFIVYGIFMAGIFEESARFIAFKILKRKYEGVVTALSYGIGHGGIESVLLAGFSMLLAIGASILINTGNVEFITARFHGEVLAAVNGQIDALLTLAPYMFLVSGIERIVAITVQLCLSIIVFYSVFGEKRLMYFPLAIVLHAIIDIPAAAMQAGVLNSVFLVEGIILLFALALAAFTKRLHDKLKNRQ
jgi:uncharacterized membrane protein YhfC